MEIESIENIKKMKKRIIKEKPVMILEGGSSYGVWKTKKVFRRDLKNMAIGESIVMSTNIARDSKVEAIKCIYKDSEGILLLHTIEIWYDLEDRDDFGCDKVIQELVYVEFVE